MNAHDVSLSLYLAGDLVIPAADIFDLERGKKEATASVARILFDYYEKYEKPPRFEGNRATVSELRDAYCKRVGADEEAAWKKLRPRKMGKVL